MVNWRDFRIEAVQAAMFTPEHAAFAPAKATGIILEGFQNRFDGEMQALPLLPDVPPEIPRVALASSDGRWRLSMAPARIDSFWNNSSGESSAKLGDVVRECVQIHEAYAEATKVRVHRLALVINRVLAVEDSPQVLVKQFCNEASQREPFNRSESFEIHNHKVYSPKHERVDYQINSWVRCRTGERTAGSQSLIWIEQDLNTLTSDAATRRFAPSQILAFHAMAVLEADEILGKYFP